MAWGKVIPPRAVASRTPCASPTGSAVFDTPTRIYFFWFESGRPSLRLEGESVRRHGLTDVQFAFSLAPTNFFLCQYRSRVHSLCLPDANDSKYDLSTAPEGGKFGYML